MIIPLDFQELLPGQFYCIERAGGNFVPAELQHFLRLAQYGDGLFESIRVENSKAPFLSYHLDRLKASANTLKFKVEDTVWSLWELQLKRLTRQWDKPIRLKIVLTRTGPGLYTPENKEGILLLKFEQLEAFKVEHAGVPLTMDRNEFHVNSLGNHKSCSALPHVLSGIRSESYGRLQTVQHHMSRGVIEAQSSNIFMRMGNQLVTPHLASGCLDGVMRKVILEWCREFDLNPLERKVLPPELDNADEIIICNAIHGPLPVVKFERRKLTDHALCDNSRKRYFEAFHGASS